MDKTLTMHDLTCLQIVAGAAERCAKVRWLNESGDILDGVARSIGDEQGNFLRSDEDVRDGYLRISSTFEYFLPVTEVMEMVSRGAFGIDS